MEYWERDFKWLETKHKIAESLGKSDLPDFYTILFLIGLQELGAVPARLRLVWDRRRRSTCWISMVQKKMA